ncbi:MAG TPA: YdeI/OmpD-associated family protein [Actinomycetota bacterium]|jgi:uncharacterized protein YdeI (YjbR/CyaY-like superfamily)
MKPRFFKTPGEFRAWLERNHDKEKELYVGFYKKASGKPSITWPEAVDQALCFGWIDGVRRSVSDDAYTNRFTPRTARSTWSAVNIARAKELKKLGLMTPAGEAAFNRRSEERSRIYSYERKNARLDPELEKELRADRKAWDFFESQAPSYRRAAVWWVVSAKKEETRRRRLATLIRDSREGRRIAAMSSPAKRS